MTEKDKNEILKLLEESKYMELKEELITYNSADIADLISEIDEIEALAIFRLLPTNLSAETFSYLDNDIQEKFIYSMTSKEAVELVDRLYIDDMVDIIEQMPDSIVKKIMRNTSKDKRELINEYLSYPKDSAGSIMTPEYFSCRGDETIEEIFKEFRNLDDMDETFYTLYTVDENNVLTGYVEIRDVLTNDPNMKISEIADENVIFVNTLDDKEDVSRILDKYQFVSIPVVDNENKLVGLVTFDDAMQVLFDETEEDFQKMAGITPNEKKYLDSSIFDLAKQRFTWLILLMFSSIISQFIITGFDATIQAVTGLIIFMPMLTGSAGNAGSQSSTTIIRSLSIDEIDISDTWEVIFKEFKIALIAGTGLAIVNFIRVTLLHSADPMLAIVSSISLLAVVIFAKMFGAILPIIAVVFKMDPTIMAAPLLTTIVDAIALLIYFSLAQLILV